MHRRSQMSFGFGGLNTNSKIKGNNKGCKGEKNEKSQKEFENFRM